MFAHNADLTVLSIVKQTVIEYQVQVLQEFLHLQVFVVGQVVLDRAEVHRVLDDLQVVRDPQLYEVHGLEEDPCAWVFPQRCHQATGCLVPTLVDLGVFRDVGHWKGVQRGTIVNRSISEKIGQIGVLSKELLELFIGQGLVIAILEYSKHE